jgi:hypothetical protein
MSVSQPLDIYGNIINLNPVTVYPGITHTVLVDDSGNIVTTYNLSAAEIVNDPTANLLSLRTNDVISQVSTLIGRSNGYRVPLGTFSFADFKMRRKAETLQYKKNQNSLSTKQQFAKISKTTSGSYYYSSQDLTQKIAAGLNCPNLDVIPRPPTNSGIRDNKYPGYYYDINVPYLPQL